jgi:hypothetical protein
MNKLQAVQYLIDAPLSNKNEWIEAGLWHAVRIVMSGLDTEFTKDYLDGLILDAINS